MSEHLKQVATLLKAVLLKRKGVTLGVWGEAGIGKSYGIKVLLRELTCQSLSLHSTTTLTTLAQNVPKAKKLASWAENTLMRLAKSEAVEADSTLDALGAALAALAPFVLHLEDLHEADNRRYEFIQKLAQMVQRIKGVGLIITTRIEPPAPFEKFRLEPLSKEQSDTLLTNEVTARLPTEALEFIYSHAAGNPLYTLEYFRLLSRQGSLWNDGKEWHWRRPEQSVMPVTVEALIELTLEKIQDEKPLTALQAKALLPLDVTDELWSKVAELSKQELETAKLELRQRGIFSDDSFAHPLFREVTVKNLSKDKQQKLARRALEVLQDDPVKAAPYIDDALLENERALELLKQASQQARDMKDRLLTGRLLAKAVHYATGEERGKLALEAVQILETIDMPLAFKMVDEATKHLSEPSEALYLHASLLAGQGEYEKMQQIVKQLPLEMREGPAWISKYMWLLHFFGKDEEKIALWESNPEMHETCAGIIITLVVESYLSTGNMPLASETIERAAKSTTLTDDDKSYLIEARATIQFYSGNYSQAESDFGEVLLLHQSRGRLPNIANMLRNRSVARMSQGRFLESLPDLEQALHIFSEAGNSLYYAETLVMMNYVLVELGEYEKTEKVLLEALEIYKRVEPQPKLADVLTQLAGLYVEWQTQTYSFLAIKYAREAERLAKGFALHSKLMAIFALARVESNPRLSLEYANEALNLATQLNILESIVNSHHVRGLALIDLGQTEEAREAFTKACQLAEEHSMILEATKYGLELDRLNNDIESARTRMRWFEERGLMNGVNIAKRYFPALVETPRDEPLAETVPRLNVLGAMQVSRDNKTQKIQGRKRQEFLALLLNARLAGRTEVGRLELLDTLYPDEDELKATGNLKTLTHTLRSSLGENIILTTGTGYSLGAIHSDAEVFLETSDTNLWRGMYLEDLGDNLADTVRDSLYLTLFEKVKGLLKTDPQEVARVAKFLLLADPYDPAYLRLSLQALRARDNYKTLKRIYGEARERFVEVGESLPENWLIFLEHTTVQ